MLNKQTYSKDQFIGPYCLTVFFFFFFKNGVFFNSVILKIFLLLYYNFVTRIFSKVYQRTYSALLVLILNNIFKIFYCFLLDIRNKHNTEPGADICTDVSIHIRGEYSLVIFSSNI